MVRNNVSNLDIHVEVDEIFNHDERIAYENPAIHEKLSKRRQVEDLLEKKRLKEELADF